MRKREMRLQTAFTARNAADLVDLASRFESEIRICQPNKEVNAKSLMGMISLELKKGDEFLLCAEGQDEEEAVLALCACLEQTGGGKRGNT